MNTENWEPIPMFCPNCGKLNYGYINSDGKIKYECDRCSVKIVRTKHSRRHDTIDLFAPSDYDDIA